MPEQSEDIWDKLTDWERSPVYKWYRKRRISALVKALDHSANSEQLRATKALIKMGKTTVSDISPLLNHENANVRKHAVHVLGKIGGSDIESALIAKLDDSDEKVQIEAVYSLGDIGSAFSIRALIGMWRNPESRPLCDAWEVLSSRGTRDIQLLLEALNDENSLVRFNTVELLKKIYETSEVPAPIVPQLVALLKKEPDLPVCREIITALGDLGDSSVTPAVIDEAIKLRRSRKIRIPDALIAATAVVTRAVLVTRNEEDFRGLAGVVIENPFC